jgi:hypothetical protein
MKPVGFSPPVRGCFLFSARRRTRSFSRFNEASDEYRLHHGSGVFDQDAGTFVQDLATEDTHGRRSTLLIDTLESDVEGQNLVGVPGLGYFLEAGDSVDDYAGQLIDRGAGCDAVVTYQCGLVDGVVGQENVRVGAELGTDVVDVGDKLAAHLVDEIEQTVTIEVHPYQGASDATLFWQKSAGRCASMLWYVWVLLLLFT